MTAEYLNNKTIRTLASEAIGIISTHNSENEVAQLNHILKEIKTLASDASGEHIITVKNTHPITTDSSA